MELTVTFDRGGVSRQSEVPIRDLVVAGWTGRDMAAVEHHIRELEALGVKRPAHIPTYYRVSANRLSTAPFIEVVGNQSSGEAEFLLVQAEGALWVGVASDHTDRQVESYNVTVSKQMCCKPMAAYLWSFDEVADHWDSLVLRSFIADKDLPEVLYQEGAVTAMRAPLDLIRGYAEGNALPEGTAMLCGTLPAIGGVRPAQKFRFELSDPVLNRTLRHEYSIRPLESAE